MAFWLSRSEIGGLADIIADLITEIKRMSDTLQDSIAQLTSDVAASRTVAESAVTLINGIPQMIATAVAQASAGGATPQQLQALNDLHTQLTQEAQRLADAVTANTPAAASGGGAPVENTGTAAATGDVAQTETVSPAGEGATGPVNPSSTFDQTGQPTGPGSSPPATPGA